MTNPTVGWPLASRTGQGGRFGVVPRLPAIAASLATVAVLAAFGAIPVLRVLGYETLIVHSGSMGDAAPVGSLVVAEPLQPAQVRVGDVVLLSRQGTGGSAGPPVLHRVLTLRHVDGQVVVRTKGDANPRPDPDAVALRGPTLTPVSVVPGVGRVLAFAGTPLGWMLLLMAPATGLLWMKLRAIWFPEPRPVPATTIPPPAHAPD